MITQTINKLNSLLAPKKPEIFSDTGHYVPIRDRGFLLCPECGGREFNILSQITIKCCRCFVTYNNLGTLGLEKQTL